MLLSSIENWYDECGMEIYGTNEKGERRKISLFSWARQCADVCVVQNTVNLMNDKEFKNLVASNLTIDQIVYLLNQKEEIKKQKNPDKKLIDQINKCETRPEKLYIRLEPNYHEVLNKKEHKKEKKHVFSMIPLLMDELKEIPPRFGTRRAQLGFLIN